MTAALGDLSQCVSCIHFRPWWTGGQESTCSAYHGGIPDALWLNAVDHRGPADGDNGVRWESDEAYPDWALPDETDEPHRSLPAGTAPPGGTAPAGVTRPRQRRYGTRHLPPARRGGVDVTTLERVQQRQAGDCDVPVLAEPVGGPIPDGRATQAARALLAAAFERAGVTDKHGHIHAQAGSSIGGQFLKKLLGGGRKPGKADRKPTSAALEPLPTPRERGGPASATVRPAFVGAASIPDLNGAASAEAKRITGRDIPFDFDGSDVQVAREYAEGVLRGLEHFPDVRLSAVRTGHAAEGVTSRDVDTEHIYAKLRELDDGTYEILFDREWSARPDELREVLAENGERRRMGRGSTTSGPMGNAIHEFGHVLDHSYHDRLERTAKLMLERFLAEEGLPRYTGDDPDERFFRDAHRRLRLGEEVSRYAVMDGPSFAGRRELAAEAFADVMENGDGAAKLSRAIVDAFEDEIGRGA